MVKFYDKEFASRLLIGSALYPSASIMQDSIRDSGAEIVTVSLRREAAGGKVGDVFWSLIQKLGVTVLPNTAGCRSVREAVTTAKMARELFGTTWIKLEVIADNDTLQPDVVGLVEAATILIKDGFEVFPYCTEDLSGRAAAGRCRLPGHHAVGGADRQRARHRQSRRAEDCCATGCPTSRWWSTPGSARRATPPKRWSSATTPCCSTPRSPRPNDPAAMARAFKLAIEGGRFGYEAGLMGPRDFASPSTPVIGTPFWHAVS